MAINLQVNFTAKGNFSQLARGLNQLGANIAGASAGIDAAGKKISKGMKGAADSTQSAAVASGLFREQQIRLLDPVDQFATAIRKGDVSMRQLSQTWKQSEGVVQRQMAMQQGYISNTKRMEDGTMRATMAMGHEEAMVARLTDRLGVANKAFGAFAHRMVNVGKNWQWTGRQLTVGISVPLGFMAFAANKAAMEVEGELVRLEKVYTTTTDNVSMELGRLRNEMDATAAQAALSFGVTSAETLKVAADFASMGYTVENGLRGMVTEAQRMQQLGEMEMPDAINLVRSVQASWKLETDELADTMNRLNAIENQTPLLLRDIAQAMPEVAAVAEDLGVRTTYAAGAMAAMREGGLDAGEAAMALRQLMIRMTDPTDVARERFQSLGIDLEQVFAGAENGEEKINRLSKALADLDPEERVGALSKLVDVRQAARIGILFDSMNQAADGVQNSWSRAYEIISADSEELAEDAAREAQRWRESAVGQAEIMKAQIQNELAEMGEPLMQLFNRVRGLIVNVLQWFNDLRGGAKQVILGLAGFAAILGPLIMLGGVLTNALFSIISLVTWVNNLGFRTQILTKEEMALKMVIDQGTMSQERYEQVLAEVAARHEYAARTGQKYEDSLRDIKEEALAANAALDQLEAGGPDTTLTGAQPVQERKGAKAKKAAGAMALLGVATIASQLLNQFQAVDGAVADVVGGFQALLTTLTMVVPMMMMFGAAITPILLVSAAIAAVIAGFKLWKNYAEDAEKASLSAGGAAEQMAKAAGLAWTEVGNVIEGDGAKAIMEFAEANKDVIEQLESIEGIAAQEAFLFEIAYEMKRHGIDDAEIKRQIKKLADEAEILGQIDMKVVLDFDPENIKEQMKQVTTYVMDWQEDQSDSWLTKTKNKFQQALQDPWAVNLYPALDPATANSLRDQAKTVAEALKTGDWEAYRAAIEGVEEAIEESGANAEEQAQAKRLLSREVAVLTGMTGFNTDAINSNIDVLRQLASGAVRTSDSVRDLAKAQVELADAEAAVAAVRDAGTPQERENALRRLAAAQTNLKDVTKEFKSDVADAAGSFADMSGEIPEVEQGILDAEAAADKFNSTLRSEMGEIQDFIAGLAMEEIDAHFDAIMDGWDRRRDKMKETHEEEREELERTQEADMKATEESFDLRIRALDDTLEKEEELDRHREHAFDREKRRRDWLQGREQGSIDVRAAIARGDLDEAARIQQQMSADETNYRIDDIKAVRDFDEETRRIRIDEQIDALEKAKEIETERLKNEQEIAAKRLKTEQDLQSKRLDAAREQAQKANDIERRAAEMRVTIWKETTAKSNADFQKKLGELGVILGDFGDGAFTNVTRTYGQIMNDNIFNGAALAVTRTHEAIREDNRWEPSGAAAREGLEKGIMGDTSGFPTFSPGDIPKGITRHSGGTVPSAARQPGLAQGEVPAVLQSGEYVVQRSAVKNLGVNFLEQLNRYHGGGIVDTIDRYMPLKAVSNTLGQVLAGRELNDTGKVGAAMYERLSGQGFLYSGGQEGTGAFERGGGNYPKKKWGVLSANTAAAMRFSKTAWNDLKAVAPDTKRGDRQSDHSWGKALDLAVTQIGKFPSEMQRALGWQVANWFVKNPREFGTKYVIWDKKINTGGGWRPYTRYSSQPNNPTLQHYDHVHASFLHGGGLAGRDGAKISIPALAKGANINFDNVLANLHRGETVLTSPLSDQLRVGLDQLANGGGTEYNINVVVQGNATPETGKTIAKEVRRELQKLDNRQGPNRRMG